MLLNPYLIFNGNCREAFEFYRSIFGGEFSRHRNLCLRSRQVQRSGSGTEPHHARLFACRLRNPSDGLRQSFPNAPTGRRKQLLNQRTHGQQGGMRYIVRQVV